MRKSEFLMLEELKSAPHLNDNKIVEISNFFFSAGLFYLVKPSHAALGQPLPQRLPGWGGWKCKKPCCWTGDQPHHGGVLCWMVGLLSTICFVLFLCRKCYGMLDKREFCFVLLCGVVNVSITAKN